MSDPAVATHNLRYCLTYRDLKEIMAERNLSVDHVTIWRWVQRYAPVLNQRIRREMRRPNRSWRVDETYVKVAGRWSYLYRAIDQHEQVIDVLVSARRDGAAARALFTRALSCGPSPVEVSTDRAPVLITGAARARRTRREVAQGWAVRW